MVAPTDPPDGSGAIVPFPVVPPSRERLTDIIKEIAKSPRWAITVAYKPTQDWRRLINRRQVELVLQEGYVLDDKAWLDEHGNWRFRVARVCAGLNVVIEVALERGPALPKLFVIDIKGDQI